MQKTIITFAILGMLASQAFASPAVPVDHDLQNGDGTTIKARQWGSEDNHGWETSDGYTIVRDEATKRWMYATKDSNGRLTPSSQPVGATKPAGSLRLRPSPPASPVPSPTQSMSLATTSPSSIPGLNGVSYSPALNANIPIILTNFSDRAPTNTAASFESKYFGVGNKSMRDYYDQVSGGKHLISSGPAGIIGWLNLTKTHDYYGIAPGTSHSLSGALTYEAVQKADATVDFSAYDNDNDCYVDTVAIVHQGAGQEASGVATDIWSHAYYLMYAQSAGYGGAGVYTTNDQCKTDLTTKVKVNKYVVVPETLYGQMHSIGTLAHEYGHVLGLPDLYDTTYASAGAGNWTLMAGGTWLGTSQAGDTPAHLDPWSKYYLGWINPIQVTSYQQHLPVDQVETGGQVYQLPNGSPTSGEYFLVENRQKTGFDAALPGSGLLIWHIDAARSGNYQRCYPGSSPACSATYHYKVAVEQADGQFSLEKSSSSRGDAGDPFSANSGKTAFSENTVPSSNFYSGSLSTVRVTEISSSGSSMTATMDASEPCSYAVTLSPTDFTSTGGKSVLSVTTNKLDCAWNMSPLPTWITTTTTGTQTGSKDQIELSVGANTSLTPRSWTVDYASKRFNIIQAARPAIVPVIDFGSTPTTVTASSMVVSGSVTENCPVKIYKNGVYVGLAIRSAAVNGKSEWSFNVTGLTPGNNSIQAIATSPDIKTTTVSLAVFYDIKFTITASATTGGAISPSGSVVVQGGSLQSFVLTADSGYRLARVSIDGVTATAISPVTFTKVLSNRKIEAIFAPPAAVDLTKTPSTVTAANVLASGTVAPYCSVQVYRNGVYVGNATIATAMDGSKTWSFATTGLVPGNNIIKAVATSIDAKIVSASMTVFYDIKYTITASATTGGTMSPSGSVVVQGGDPQIFTLTPDSGFRLARLSIDGIAVAPVSPVTFAKVVSNRRIEAIFAPPVAVDLSKTATTVTSASVTAGGTVAPYCTVQVYRNGTFVGNAPITTAGDGTKAWALPITGLVPGNNSIKTVATSIDGKTTYASQTVVYDVNFTINTTATTGGSISPLGSTTVKGGSSQTITITPATGYRIARIVFNDVSVPITNVITISNVIRNHSISVTFLPPVTVDTSAAANATTITTTSSSATIGGVVAPGCTVQVYRNNLLVGTATQTATSGENKNWSFTLTGLMPGTNAIKTVATSIDGKVATATLSVIYDIDFVITTSATAGGTVSPAGSTTVKGGSTQNITITPAVGYRTAKILFNDVSVPIVSGITIQNVIRNHKLAVTFLPPVTIDFSTTATSIISGSISTGGKVAPGCTVQIYRNGTWVGTAPQTTLGDGSKAWALPMTGLIRGTNTIKAVATSIDNKVVSASLVVPY